jgi:hypothetical protein
MHSRISALIVAMSTTYLLGAAAKADDFQVFAAPLKNLSRDNGISNYTCYFTNMGEKGVKIKNARFVNYNGGILSSDFDNCTSLENATLKPGSSCFIGRNNVGLAACASLVSDGPAMRGTLEQRTSDGTVIDRSRIATGTGSASAEKFETIASSTTFGAPEQYYVRCSITNFGSKPARIKNYKVTTSTGQKLPLTYDTCSSGFISPNNTCYFDASAREPMVTDRACRASVNFKANIRGAIDYQKGGYTYSSAPME